MLKLIIIWILCIQYGKVKDEKYLNSMKEIFQMSAKTFYGFEDVLCEELKNINAIDVFKSNRIVHFR